MNESLVNSSFDEKIDHHRDEKCAQKPCAVFANFVYYDLKFELCGFNLSDLRAILAQAEILKEKYFCIFISHYEIYKYFQSPDFTSSKPFLILQVFAKKITFKPLKIKHLNYHANFIQKLDKKISKVNFKAVKNALKKGQSYQVNLSQELRLKSEISPFLLFNFLLKRQNAEFKAYIKHSWGEILCFSPELFFYLDKNLIKTQPMKGTIKAYKDEKKNQKSIEFLKTDTKNLSENVMIVDLLRADLSKLAKPFSLKANKLFEIKSLKTLHQMVSNIEAELKDGIKMLDILKALFPCGSVTGAPKIETMKLISQLEARERGVYCGSIGLWHKQEAIFNVAIRTLWREKNESFYRYGVGAGLVSESKRKDEFEEFKLKTKFLKPKNDFYLFETMLLKNTHILFFKEHLQRLINSALKLDFKCENLKKNFKDILSKKRNFNEFQGLSLNKVNEKVFNHSHSFLDAFDFEKFLKKEELKNLQISNENHALKLILHKNGAFEFEISALQKSPSNALILSSEPIFKDDLSTHKTSKRAKFKKASKLWQKGLCYEVAFLNEQELLCEGSRSNLALKIDDEILTPSLECGLLNGIYRQFLLHLNVIKEANLDKDTLLKASEIYSLNSLRGLKSVILQDFNAHIKSTKPIKIINKRAQNA